MRTAYRPGLCRRNACSAGGDAAPSLRRAQDRRAPGRDGTRSRCDLQLGAGSRRACPAVAAEEEILDRIVLTNEQGFIGGAPLTGVDSGAAQNYDAIVDQPYQFDFYDGGGLDIAFLSFAEVDPSGNVNISRFGDKIVGIGGFVNISQNARTVVFSGTFHRAA
jgi:acyl CoA:acetate/3-ketoacid CoA transferase